MCFCVSVPDFWAIMQGNFTTLSVAAGIVCLKIKFCLFKFIASTFSFCYIRWNRVDLFNVQSVFIGTSFMRRKWEGWCKSFSPLTSQSFLADYWWNRFELFIPMLKVWRSRKLVKPRGFEDVWLKEVKAGSIIWSPLRFMSILKKNFDCSVVTALWPRVSCRLSLFE